MKALLFSLSCLAAVSMGAQTLPLIPYPQEVTRQAGTFKADPNEIHHFTIIKNGVREMDMGESHIRTTQDATLGAEGYRLQSAPTASTSPTTRPQDCSTPRRRCANSHGQRTTNCLS